MQGIGQALMRAGGLRRASGQLVTGSFMDYGVPRADDLPRFATEFDNLDPCLINPLGVKGVGELGTIGATPAVMNAVVDALAGRLGRDRQIAMPATPERVWRAIREARKSA